MKDSIKYVEATFWWVLSVNINSMSLYVIRLFSAYNLMKCCYLLQSFFHPLELQAMIVGNQEYNWAELEKVCKLTVHVHHLSILSFVHVLLLLYASTEL